MKGWIRSIDEGFAFIPALNNVQCSPMMRPLCSRARTTTRGRMLTSQVSLVSGASLLGCERRSRERSTSKDFFKSLSKNLRLVVNLVLESNEQHYNLTIRRTCKFIPPTMVHGGGLVPPLSPLGFWYAAIFRNDFAFIGKPLIFSTRWGIFHGWCAAGGLWRHQTWSPRFLKLGSNSEN